MPRELTKRHRPTGCNLVHPFALRPDVEWAKEDTSTFNTKSWTYIKSQAAHAEFQRFRYRSLAGLPLPIVLCIAGFFFALFHEITVATAISIGYAALWFVFIPLEIYAHVKKVSESRTWVTVRVAVEVVLLVDILKTGGYFQFEWLYNCETFDRGLEAAWGRNNDTHPFSPEVQQRYCREIVHPYVGISILFIPIVTNVPPLWIGVFMTARFIQEVLNRPIAHATGLYNPPESGAHLVTKSLHLVIITLWGAVIYWLRSKAGKRQFEQTILMTRQTQEAERQEEDTDLLLSATVPASALMRLAANEPVKDYTDSASVLFSDMVGFTKWSSSRSASEVVRMLNILTENIDTEAIRLKVEKIKTIGDAYWAVTGLPDEVEDHALVMCHFGLQMLKIVKDQVALHAEWGLVQLRVGINSGALNGGILGSKMISYEVFGQTSDIANTLEQMGVPDKVLISQATMKEADLHLGEPHGEVEIEGVVGGATATTATTTYLLTDEVFEPHRSRLKGAAPRAADAGDQKVTAANEGLGGAVASSAERESTGSFFETISVRSAQHEVGAEDVGKARRKTFLKQRAKAQAKRKQYEAEANDNKGVNVLAGSSEVQSGPESMPTTLAEDDETEENIEKQHTTYRYPVLLSTVKDEALDAEYIRFALSKQRALRFWTRVFLVSTPILLLASMGIDQASPDSRPPSTASLILLFLALLSACIDLGLLYATAYLNKGAEQPVVQLALNNLTPSLCLLAALTAEPGSSVLMNDPSWLCAPFLAFSLVGNSAVIGTLWLVLLNFFVLWPLVWAASWRVWLFSYSRLIELQLLVVGSCLLAVIERQVRRQFLDTKLEVFFRREQLKRVVEQEALLNAIVPDHISGSLLEWMSGDMLNPLVRTYPTAAVAFLRLLPGQAAISSSHIDLVKKNSLEEGPKGLLPPPTPPEGKVIGAPIESETDFAHDSRETTPEPRENKSDWLSDSALAVDELIAEMPSVTISKIKMIGDLLMVGGPFRSGSIGSAEGTRTKLQENRGGVIDDASTAKMSSETDAMGSRREMSQLPSQAPIDERTVEYSDQEVKIALQEIVQLARGLSRVAGGVQAGIHVGPLVGAIQGTSRVCFDIFGDTVNVASRVLTGASTSQQQQQQQQRGGGGSTSGGFWVPSAGVETASFCAVTTEVHELLREDSSAFQFQEDYVDAKGKGKLKVFYVHFGEKQKCTEDEDVVIDI